MKGWIRKTWMGCVVAVSLVSVAHANTGTITFSGAVVTPTCSPDQRSYASGGGATAIAHLGCTGVDAAADGSQLYELRVTALQGSALASDRVIRYFAGYAKDIGNDAASLKLLTQTFE